MDDLQPGVRIRGVELELGRELVQLVVRCAKRGVLL